jgi:hypothetical protein
MWLLDPSEAVSSRQIVPLLDSLFERLEFYERGGNLTQLFFYRIAGNFANDDPEAREIVRRVIAEERAALARGILRSDYIFGLWRNLP